jgi:putative transcriptional regulator
MKKRYKSKVLEAIHETVEGLHTIGLIKDDEKTHFDTLCLQQNNELTPNEIYEIRAKIGVSQPVFADYMGVSKTSISAWENGTKKPSGTAKRLLRVISQHGIHIITEQRVINQNEIHEIHIITTTEQRTSPLTPFHKKAIT